MDTIKNKILLANKLEELYELVQGSGWECSKGISDYLKKALQELLAE